MHRDFHPVRRASLADLDLGRYAGACEPKIDGVWCALRCEAGRIVAMEGRTGAQLREGLTREWQRWEYRRVQIGTRRWRGVRPIYESRRELVGEAVGLPDGTYLAELEVLTERAEAAAREHGHHRLHLRDAREVEGRDLRALPSGVRRAALERAYRAVPEALRSRLVLIERRHLSGPAAAAWAREIIAAGGEGIVVHGRDGARKIKGSATVDLVVLRVEWTRRGARRVALGATDPITGAVVEVAAALVPARSTIRAGQIVELRHNGSTAQGGYRHPRLSRDAGAGWTIVRTRTDKTTPDDAATVREMAAVAAADTLGLSPRSVRRWSGIVGRPAHGRADVAGIARARRIAGLSGRRSRIVAFAGWTAAPPAATLGPCLGQINPPPLWGSLAAISCACSSLGSGASTAPAASRRGSA